MALRTDTTDDLAVDVLEHIYNRPDIFRDPERIRLEIGIWDAADVPYTVYALLTNGLDHDVIAGERSYGSGTVGEALAALLDELQEIIDREDRKPHERTT